MGPVQVKIILDNNKEFKTMVVDLVETGEDVEVEEEAKLVEEETKEDRLDSNSKDNDPIKPTSKIIKNRPIKELSIKFARNLATLLLCVGSSLHR